MYSLVLLIACWFGLNGVHVVANACTFLLCVLAAFAYRWRVPRPNLHWMHHVAEGMADANHVGGERTHSQHSATTIVPR